MNLREKVLEWKKKRNAVILVHNYQLPEVQDIADYLGDSLGLSRQAARTDADVIVFCGVYFMAETAKILSPEKVVLIPDPAAGCPMADMITAEQLRSLKAHFPKAKTLCYVNTPAEVKAECDLCCTSANAIKVVKEAFDDNEEIIFVPDKYLTYYVSQKLNREFIPWQGYCPTHVRILAQDIETKKRQYPDALVMVHPECRPEVIALADEVLSTEGMCRFARQSSARKFIVGTEIGIIYRLKKENPDKEFIPASELAICPNMKLTTLEKVLWALQDLKHEIILSPEIINRARLSIEGMLSFVDRRC